MSESSIFAYKVGGPNHTHPADCIWYDSATVQARLEHPHPTAHFEPEITLGYPTAHFEPEITLGSQPPQPLMFENTFPSRNLQPEDQLEITWNMTVDDAPVRTEIVDNNINAHIQTLQNNKPKEKSFVDKFNTVLDYAKTSGFFDHMITDDEDKEKNFKEFFDTLQRISGGDVSHLIRNLRSVQLIKDALTPEEFEELTKENKVTIKSKLYKNREYVVHVDPEQRVDVLEKGKKKKELCGIVLSSETDEYGRRFVDGDRLLSKIITLKTNEKHYLNNSNEF